ncbi:MULTISPECIES: hypothetical protein [Aphanothece]|uniref:hypothetical protein n=1 Tax=Aphanothece TaxID=1121 RepID=UPI0039851234
MLPTPWGPLPRPRLGGSLPRTLPRNLAVILLGGTALLPAVGMVPRPARANAVDRPPGLVVLEERPSLEGLQVLGVYGPVADADSPGLWRAQLWRQQGTNVTIQTDTVGCTPEAPMRLTAENGRRLIRSLNPGGVITPANRADHLVWWAVCHPERAGQDPSGLTAVARQLGYSTTLRESEQVLPGRSR